MSAIFSDAADLIITSSASGQFMIPWPLTYWIDPCPRQSRPANKTQKYYYLVYGINHWIASILMMRSPSSAGEQIRTISPYRGIYHYMS